MKINSVDLTGYLNGSFFRPLGEVILTQKKAEHPRVLSGPGSIEMVNGKLKVNLFHEYVGDEKQHFMHADFATRAGELIKDESYCSMVATDINGGRWSGAHFSIGGEFGVQSAFISAESNSCVKITSALNTATKQLTYWMRGEQTLPFGVEAGGAKFQYEGGVVSLQNKDGHSVLIFSDDAAAPHHAKSLFQALQIISGRLIEVVAIHSCLGEGSVLELFPYDDEPQNAALPPPVAIDRPGGAMSFQAYLVSMSKFLTAEPWVAGYWHKINGVWQAGLLNAGLSITVSIEGLLKGLYEPNGIDSAFADMANSAAPLVRGLELDSRVRDRLITSLDHAGSFSAKAALKNICQNAFFDSSSEKDWSALRNAAAHADRTDGDLQAQQKLVSRTFANLRLFYDLIAWRAGYRGRRIDYARLGFPEIDTFEPAPEN